jgi:hypothetical protein
MLRLRKAKEVESLCCGGWEEVKIDQSTIFISILTNVTADVAAVKSSTVTDCYHHCCYIKTLVWEIGVQRVTGLH